MTSIIHLKREARTLRRAALVSAAAVCLLSNSAWSMLAPARTAPAAGGAGFDRTADVKTVQTALESKMVRDRLKAFGLSDKEIESRLAKLSDRQLHKLSKDIKALNPGGGLIYVLEVVILVLIILILI